jgi:hypothetical protein
MDQALRASTVRIAASLGTLWVLLFALPLASAQLPLEVNGLRGGRYVGSAGPPASAPTAVLGLGYAYTGDVLDDNDSHQRLSAELAAGWAPWRYLQLSLGVDARYDAHSGDVGTDSGGAFGTQLATRHAFALSPALALAARTKLRFPASATVSRGLRSASPELGAIASYLFGRAYELSLDLGFRVDRSEESLRRPSALSEADLLAASVSRYNAALLGALFALPIGPVTASAEWSWDIAVGSGSPSALASPMRVRLAAQTRLAGRYVPGIELGLSPSARPSLDRLARIEPRAWFALTLGVVFERAQRGSSAQRGTGPAWMAASASELEPALLELRVSDPAGVPVLGANVELAQDESPRRAVTDADGVATFPLEPERRHTLRVTSDGFEPHEAIVEGTPGRRVLGVTLARVLPEGEIKGSVRGLRGGKPVRARITVAPLNRSVDTDERGEFVIGVPPGQYTLEISSPGYEPQQRSAQVERLGVTILVVDLRRATK